MPNHNSNGINLKMYLSPAEMNTLLVTIERSSVPSKELKELSIACISEAIRDWQLIESRERIIRMATELNKSAPNVDNMLSVSAIQDELNTLARSLGRKFVTEMPKGFANEAN
jgi:hypothetical protein